MPGPCLLPAPSIPAWKLLGSILENYEFSREDDTGRGDGRAGRLGCAGCCSTLRVTLACGLRVGTGFALKDWAVESLAFGWPDADGGDFGKGLGSSV
jgi:hypothetical protein